jgi:hypothetical protein
MHPKYTTEYLNATHPLCYNNHNVIIQSTQCVYFYCKHLFDSEAIKNWIEGETEKTAMCPHCGIDAVIGDASNAPIKDSEFVEAMHQHCFSET